MIGYCFLAILATLLLSPEALARILPYRLLEAVSLNAHNNPLVRDGNQITFWTLCDGGFYFDHGEAVPGRKAPCSYEIVDGKWSVLITDGLTAAEDVLRCVVELEAGTGVTVEPLPEEARSDLERSHFYSNVLDWWERARWDEREHPDGASWVVKWWRRLSDAVDYFTHRPDLTFKKRGSSEVSWLYTITNTTIMRLFRTLRQRLDNNDDNLFLFQNSLMEGDAANFLYAFDASKGAMYKFIHTC